MASFNLVPDDNLTAPTKAPIITSLPPRPTGGRKNLYWCTDSGLTQEYNGDSYLVNKVDLYLKLQINEYNITFMECDLTKATVLDESDVDLSQYKLTKLVMNLKGGIINTT